MKKIISLCLLAFLMYSATFAQTCASPFAPGLTALNETCNPSGTASYAIDVNTTSDSALVFVGLWEVPTSSISADVDCNTHTFSIPRQFLFNTFEIEGWGTLNLPDVNIRYRVFQDGVSTTPIDSCNGTYQGVMAGIRVSLQTQCTLSPNPTHTSTLLQIKGNDSPGATWTYRVLDMQGRDVHVGALDASMQAMIDTQRLATGMYRVVVQSSDGQLASKVLVVQ